MYYDSDLEMHDMYNEDAKNAKDNDFIKKIGPME